MSGRSENPLKRIIGEIHRRSLWQVLAIYAVASWAVFEVVQTLTEGLGLPGWLPGFAFVLLIIGLPLVLATAFVQEGGPGRGTADTMADLDEIFSEKETSEQTGPGGIRSVFTWRNALLGGMAAFALWGVVAAGWVLLGGVAPESDPGMLSAVENGEATVAVLPFDNLSRAEDTQSFVDGVHDDLITRLSNISGLKVISRRSVLKYRDTRLSLPAIADSLGAQWIVEAGVQQAGERVQVNAQLIDAREDANRWAESYQRDLTTENLFAIQSDLTKRIARSLQAQLSPEEQERVERQPTQDLDAFRLYVQGRNLLDPRTSASIREARSYFEQALREDSAYALAWSGLADSYVLEASYSPDIELATALPKARAAAHRAVGVDPDLAEAHASLGLLHLSELGMNPTPQNGPAALRELQRAVALKPSYAQAHHWLGILQCAVGWLETCLEHFSLAVELNPDNYAARESFFVGMVADRQYGEALEQAEILQRIGKEGEILDWRVAVALAHQKRWEELRERVRRNPPDAMGSARVLVPELALADIALGDTASARRRLAQMRRRPKARFEGLPNPLFDVALVEAALGNHDAALSTLREYSRHVGNYGTFILRFFYPDVLGPIRDDPRFQELIHDLEARYGLNPDGTIPETDSSR